MSSAQREKKHKMLKAYISHWKRREKPEERHIVDFWVTTDPKKAAPYETKQEAENDCVLFERFPILIASSEGGTHTCTGWKVEELAPKEFVVFCVAPFIIGARGESVKP
jgi:hypothetical protein